MSQNQNQNHNHNIPSEYNLSPGSAISFYSLRNPRPSPDSTNVVPDSIWFSSNFILGAGSVIIQPSSGKMVLIYDRKGRWWLLPKGRKDLGESIESAVLREAYEETGYRAKFLPLAIPSLAPRPNPSSGTSPSPNGTTPADSEPSLNCEPFYITTQAMIPTDWSIKDNNEWLEYITFWYVLYIEEDAIRDEGTGVEGEEGFETHLMEFSEAIDKLWGMQQAVVVSRAWRLWKETVEMMQSANSTSI